MKKGTTFLTTLCFSLLLCFSCSEKKQEKPSVSQSTQETVKNERFLGSYPIAISTSNYPLTYFTEQISDGLAIVTFPIDMDGDPAFWEPTEDGILVFQKSDLIIFNGAGFEKWATHVTLPESEIVDTSVVFEAQYIARRDTTTHSHGPGGEHSHGSIDFTTWIDPLQAVQQAESIKEALVTLTSHPTTQEFLQTGFETLKTSLLELDKELQTVFEGKSDITIIASHPVYDYMARRYDLEIKSLHWEPDIFPAEDEWQKLQTIISEDPANLIIWEDTPLPETSDKLAEMGLTSVVFNPCGNTPDEGDYLSVMTKNVNNLKAYFQKDSEQ